VSQTEAPSRIPRYLPGRLVVAWAVLGAAAGGAFMYLPFVYQAHSTDLPLFTTIMPLEGRVRVLGIPVYHDRQWKPGPVRRAIDEWRRRVTVGFAGVGAVLGAMVGRHEQRRRPRPSSPAARGGWLGLSASVAVFAFLFVVGTPGDVEWSLYEWLRWEIRWFDLLKISVWHRLLAFYAIDAVLLTIASIAIGWAVHVAAGARGVRWSPGRRPEQAADYGDDVADGLQGGAATNADLGGQALVAETAPGGRNGLQGT
jgi:hypothetical protein